MQASIVSSDSESKVHKSDLQRAMTTSYKISRNGQTPTTNVRYGPSCRHSHLLPVELFPAIASKIENCIEANKVPAKKPRSKENLDPSKRARTDSNTATETIEAEGAASMI